MAILLPFYMILLLGVIDFCRVFYAGVAVTQAARAGTQYGVRNAIISQSALYTGMRQAATDAANDYGFTATSSWGTMSTPTVERSCVCGGGTPPTCPGGGGGCSPPGCTNYQIYVCTSTSYTFSTFAHYPGIPTNATLTRVSMMRAQ